MTLNQAELPIECAHALHPALIESFLWFCAALVYGV